MKATDEITEKRISNLKKFLDLTYKNLKARKSVSMTSFRSAFNISYDILEYLQDNNVLHVEGTGRGATWQWVSKKPSSREMAVKVLTEVIESKKAKITLSKKDKQFEDIISGKGISNSKGEKTVLNTQELPSKKDTTIKETEGTLKAREVVEPTKKKAYGITRLFFGLLKLRTDYFE